MGADPQFGKRPAGCVLHIQKIRNEAMTAPIVVLHHTLQRQYTRFSLNSFLHPAQDTCRFFDAHSSDCIGTVLGVGDGVDPQLIRIPEGRTWATSPLVNRTRTPSV
jgi:hypothetical protein